MEDVALRAAVFFGHSNAQKSVATCCLPQLPRHVALLLPSVVERDTLVVEELPRHFLHDIVILCILEVRRCISVGTQGSLGLKLRSGFFKQETHAPGTCRGLSRRYPVFQSPVNYLLDMQAFFRWPGPPWRSSEPTAGERGKTWWMCVLNFNLIVSDQEKTPCLDGKVSF